MQREQTSHHPPNLNSKQVTVPSLLSAASVIYFIFVIVLLHFLRPELNPRTHYLSEFALGRFDFLMTSAFGAFALAAFTLAVGLRRASTASAFSKAGLVFLAVGGGWMLMAGIFKGDLQNSTTAGKIHGVAALFSFLSMMIAMLLLSFHFNRDTRWQSYFGTSLGIALFSVVAFLGYIAAEKARQPGLGQRIFVATMLLWLFCTALQVVTKHREIVHHRARSINICLLMVASSSETSLWFSMLAAMCCMTS